MRRTTRLALACALPLLACDTAVAPEPRAAAAGPSLHVGVQPRDLPLGRVADDVECHVGQRGFPDVKTRDSHVTESASGVVTLTCHGQLPPGTEPTSAVIETGVLCFLPEGRSTRDAWEVFTPSGKINLTCRFRP